jgi:hypothetical protein
VMGKNRFSARSIVGCTVPLAIVAWAAGAQAGSGTLQLQGSFSGATDAFYGYSVAIDGNTAVVGALDDDAGLGAAYVLVRSGTTWALQQKLTAADGAANDQFGYSVAVSGDTAFIGAAGKASGQGYVYAFTRSGTTWAQQQEFTEASGAADDCFGCALALSGGTAVIGADGASGNLGTAYVFASTGATWSQQAEFLGASTSDFFGFSVALSPDGGTALVGAFGTSGGKGSAYVFSRSGTTWSQPQAPLVASDGQAGDRFGYAVALGTGTAVIGAYAKGGPGAAYVFAQSGSSWTQQSELTPPDPSGSDNFGAAVALDGSTAVIGAYERAGTGTAYVYTGGSGGFTQAPQELAAPTGSQDFGFSVAASGGTVAVGAFGTSNDAGNAQLFAPAPVVLPVPALGGAPRVWALTLLLGAVGVLATRPRRGVRAS